MEHRRTLKWKNDCEDSRTHLHFVAYLGWADVQKKTTNTLKEEKGLCFDTGNHRHYFIGQPPWSMFLRLIYLILVVLTLHFS